MSMVPSAIPGTVMGFMARAGIDGSPSPAAGRAVAAIAEDLCNRLPEADRRLVMSRAVG
jgi:hypothetical protein